MKSINKFNQSKFSHWINSPSGRIFRLCAGLFFIVLGIIFHRTPLGITFIVWSLFPLSAGSLDICYISAVLGGPLSGSRIRKQQAENNRFN